MALRLIGGRNQVFLRSNQSAGGEGVEDGAALRTRTPADVAGVREGSGAADARARVEVLQADLRIRPLLAESVSTRRREEAASQLDCWLAAVVLTGLRCGSI